MAYAFVVGTTFCLELTRHCVIKTAMGTPPGRNQRKESLVRIILLCNSFIIGKLKFYFRREEEKEERTQEEKEREKREE